MKTNYLKIRLCAFSSASCSTQFHVNNKKSFVIIGGCIFHDANALSARNKSLEM